MWPNQVQVILKATESIIADFNTNAMHQESALVVQGTRRWRCCIRVVLFGLRGTCTSVRLYARVRNIIAGKGAKKQPLQVVQQLVTKLQVEAQHHTACVERGGRWCMCSYSQGLDGTTSNSLQRYAIENIWSKDETACFFWALLERELADAKKQCKGG